MTDDLAIIQTVDFFTPIVDDPYSFGKIAAANALSDVYAMGGRPITAMNLVGFPLATMDIGILRDILRGGMDILKAAGVTLVGGHSIEDAELKYGLSVTGTVHPQKVITNVGGRPGDRLILTKPIGTGIINTAIKAGQADDLTISSVIDKMSELNRAAADIMARNRIHACTDVTGFGLLGHMAEMMQGGDVGICIDHTAVPVFAKTPDYAEMGLIPGGAYRNRDYRAHMVDFDTGLPAWVPIVFFDPQTSGGLIIVTPEADAQGLVQEIHLAGVSDAAIIGEVVDTPKGRIRVI